MAGAPADLPHATSAISLTASRSVPNFLSAVCPVRLDLYAQLLLAISAGVVCSLVLLPRKHSMYASKALSPTPIMGDKKSMYAALRSKGMPNLGAADLFQVKGKVALVTGGGRGIGFMIAAGLVQNGATVYITSRKAAACEQAARELSSLSSGSGGSCIALPPMDLADGVNAEQKLKDALAAAGVTKMNILVNNSGTSWGQPFDEFEEKGWDRVMNLNVRAVFYVTRACLPLLKAAASKDCKSRIINIGSIAGLDCQVVPTYSYDVSKAAVHHLTRKFAAEFAYNDITCNAVAPGLVPSLMSDQLLSYASQEVLESNIPLKRVGSMEDMAGVTLFLCSRAGEWVTGAIIPVDGGALLSKL